MQAPAVDRSKFVEQLCLSSTVVACKMGRAEMQATAPYNLELIEANNKEQQDVDKFQSLAGPR